MENPSYLFISNVSRDAKGGFPICLFLILIRRKGAWPYGVFYASFQALRINIWRRRSQAIHLRPPSSAAVGSKQKVVISKVSLTFPLYPL